MVRFDKLFLFKELQYDAVARCRLAATLCRVEHDTEDRQWVRSSGSPAPEISRGATNRCTGHFEEVAKKRFFRISGERATASAWLPEQCAQPIGNGNERTT